MLNLWKTYLLAHFEKVQRIEDFGALCEQFIAAFLKFDKEACFFKKKQASLSNEVSKKGANLPAQID